MTKAISITALSNFPDVREGDDICEIICRCLDLDNISLLDDDVVCVAHKIVSKAEGRVVALSNVTPSEQALCYAKKLNKDPRKVEVILNESKKVLRNFKHEGQNEGVMICQHRLGFISANAGIDESNVEQIDQVLLLPLDPDKSASKLRVELEKRYEKKIGIVITDTFGRPWRLGQVNVAIGLSGIPCTISERGNIDAYGRKLSVTEPAFCDEIAAASGLITSKAGKTPVTIFRGLSWRKWDGKIVDILRSEKENMFL